jgi:Zn-dependent protease
MTTVDSPRPPNLRTPEQYQQIIEVVHHRFNVMKEFYGENRELEFVVNPAQSDTKSAFLELTNELRATDDMAILRRSDDGLYLKVFPRPPSPKSKTRTPIILLVATIGTIFLDGLIRGFGSTNLSQLIVFSLIYAVALIGIVGVHETGHKIASWYHKMNSSWPYFIPGIPGLFPTYGAVINAREPPPNRDALFDLGLSGPVAGLAATLVVSVFAVASAQITRMTPSVSYTNVDYYTTFLAQLLVKAPPGYAITGTLFTLLYFAYTIGFLLTFANLLPAWQLDGGHVANAAVSPKVHKYLTYVSAGVLALTGFLLMAVLVLFLSNRYPSLTPLDDVSPLSRNRKILFCLVWVITAAIAVLVIYNNLFFWQGSFMQYLLSYL